MNIKIKKKYIDFLSEPTIDYWDKLEIIVGKPCNTVEELLSETIVKIVSLINTYENPDENRELLVFQTALSNEQEKTESLQIELSKMQKKIKSLEQTLAEKQEEINQLAEQSDTQKDSDLEDLLAEKGKQINSTLKHLIDVQELIDRTEYDKHLTKEVALQAIMKQTEDALNQLGVTVMNKVGEPFNSKFQTIITIQETDKSNENNIVCESLKSGYRKEDYCIKEQEVVIYQYKE